MVLNEVKFGMVVRQGKRYFKMVGLRLIDGVIQVELENGDQISTYPPKDLSSLSGIEHGHGDTIGSIFEVEIRDTVQKVLEGNPLLPDRQV